MKIPHPVTVDFETMGIEPRPDYPPVPVGVSIKSWGKKPRYYAWGHVTAWRGASDGEIVRMEDNDNNCTKEVAIAALRAVWDNPDGLLFHNAKFDVDVAETHLGLRQPSWDRIHDTMFLMFLFDPHSRTVALKPIADSLLGMPPDERDAVADWLAENQPVPGVRVSRSPNGREPPGKYIAYAPGDSVVGPYANGDTVRTEALFKYLYAQIAERGMLPAYDRERRLMPILLDMERNGIPVDLPRLRADVALYTQALAKCDDYIYRRLSIRDPEFNINSGQQLINALDVAGAVDVTKLGVTDKGAIRSDKKALQEAVADRKLVAVLVYRAQLKTCLNTFMEPWLATAVASGGSIYTNWNQTRGDKKGTRTGRLSSNPNFQNIPLEFDEIKMPFKVPPLPMCRGYLVARKGEVLCGRDFASQELRVLAHFEDGTMAKGYHDNPAVDFHQLAADMVTRTTGVEVTRKRAKTIGFAILYGTGRPALAAQLGVTVTEADRLLSAYYMVFPGIKTLQTGIRMRAGAGQPIRTAGGREYFVEPPRIVNGRMMNFSYKLMNYLIQGSSADQTKDAMIRYYDVVGPGKLLLSVHDEILTSVPTKERRRYMEILKISMNDAGLDVPMLSDGEWGVNWATMEAV